MTKHINAFIRVMMKVSFSQILCRLELLVKFVRLIGNFALIFGKVGCGRSYASTLFLNPARVFQNCLERFYSLSRASRD